MSASTTTSCHIQKIRTLTTPPKTKLNWTQKDKDQHISQNSADMERIQRFRLGFLFVLTVVTFLVHPVYQHQHQCNHEDNGRHFIIERRNSDQNMSGGTDCSEHKVGLACLPGLTTRAKPTSAKSVKVRQSHSNVSKTSDRVEIVERLVRKLPK